MPSFPDEQEPRVLAGTARLRAAVEHLAHAREHLESALADLSSILVVDRESRRIKRMVHEVKSSFYILEMTAKRLPRGGHRQLDRDPDKRELELIRRGGNEAVSHFGCGDHR